MAPSALTEVKDLTAAVGDRVLSVFGQIQFHDVILQRCRDGLRRTLAGGLRAVRSRTDEPSDDRLAEPIVAPRGAVVHVPRGPEHAGSGQGPGASNG